MAAGRDLLSIVLKGIKERERESGSTFKKWLLQNDFSSLALLSKTDPSVRPGLAASFPFCRISNICLSLLSNTKKKKERAGTSLKTKYEKCSDLGQREAPLSLL